LTFLFKHHYAEALDILLLIDRIIFIVIWLFQDMSWRILAKMACALLRAKKGISSRSSWSFGQGGEASK
jgi:hypothetical protein